MTAKWLVADTNTKKLVLFCYNVPVKTCHYTVKGRVQGVAFRFYTVREAEKFGISGTVRNLENGDVEVYAQGNDAAIAQFESFLHIGPRFARVDQVKKEVLAQIEVFKGFDIGW